ncbi:DegT/DnrJ/EryC1/StrS family aminotransferase [bacterium]|nr:DegT/DnrJ/EryC1/StrS family aminotransferase [bacterium]
MSDTPSPSMNVPPLRLPEQHAPIRDAMAQRLLAVLDSGGYILGKEGKELEQRLAAYCGAKSALALNSGTDALIIGLAALGVGCGDEVITPPFTFIATSEAARWLGARPVFVDIEPETFNIDPARIESAVTPNTKALIPVHLYGHPADMDEILPITDDLGISVLEDMAQAIGATYKGRKVGGLSAAAALSFYPTKNLGACGDGGMLLMNRERLLEPATLLRNHGQHERYYHLSDGLNSRLDEFQAAVLNVKLDKLDEWNGLRAEAAAYYNAHLDGVPGITTPKVAEGCTHVYHQYTIRVSSEGWVEWQAPQGWGAANSPAGIKAGAHRCSAKAHSEDGAAYRSGRYPEGEVPPTHGKSLPNPARRDAVMAHLRASGVVAMIYYPVPLHLQNVYSIYGHRPGDFPVTERAAAEVLSLPIHPGITRAEQDYVIAKIREAVVEL